MPIFEYKCAECGRISEFLETGGGKADRICIHCGSKKLNKQISVFAPQIKEGDSKRCHGCSDRTCPHSGY